MNMQGIVTTTRRAILVGSMAGLLAVGLSGGGAEARTKGYAVLTPPTDFYLCTLASINYMETLYEAGQHPGTVSDAEIAAAEGVMKDLCYTAPPVNIWD